MKSPKLSFAVAAAVIFAGQAIAHPEPKTANPKPNAVLSVSPSEIRIGFSEPLELAFSGMDMSDQNGKAVTLGAASINPQNSKELIVPVSGALAPGTYTVQWHVVGDDTHRVTGHYSFQVKP